MNNNDHNGHNAGGRRTSNSPAAPDQSFLRDGERREPGLDDFDSDENYEESDRDTDYASIYTEDILDDDEVEELLQGAKTPREQDREQDNAVTGNTLNNEPTMVPHSAATGLDPEEYDQIDTNKWQAENSDEFNGDTSPRWTGTDPREDFQNNLEYDDDDDEVELWDDEDDYGGESRATWPLGLIAVAVVALLLLGAGGYGVVQQRAAMESEIRELQAALATAASPEDVAASRDEVTKMRTRYEELRITLNSLNLENRGLRDTVSGLESQLAAQQAIAKTARASKPAAAKPAPKPAAPKPAAPKQAAPKQAAPKPAAAKPAVQKAPATTAASNQAVAATGWFVNFGSYSKRATAESWANRLQPAAGKVIVATGDKAGNTFYRVRVVSLSSKDQAERVARELEKSYGLSRLWVGKQ